MAGNYDARGDENCDDKGKSVAGEVFAMSQVSSEGSTEHPTAPTEKITE